MELLPTGSSSIKVCLMSGASLDPERELKVKLDASISRINLCLKKILTENPTELIGLIGSPGGKTFTVRVSQKFGEDDVPGTVRGYREVGISAHSAPEEEIEFKLQRDHAATILFRGRTILSTFQDSPGDRRDQHEARKVALKAASLIEDALSHHLKTRRCFRNADVNERSGAACFGESGANLAKGLPLSEVTSDAARMLGLI